MAIVLRDVPSIVNAALDRIGYKKRIGSLYDGSEQSVKALDIYGQTRDELLRRFDWGFAERNSTLTLLKTAPVGGYSTLQPWSNVYPAPPWIYEYEYPSDMIKLRSLRVAGPIPEMDPVAIEFSISNDSSYTPSKRVILTNLASAIATYTGQETNPAVWDEGFIEALIDALGRRLAPALNEMEAVKTQAQLEAMSLNNAEQEEEG